MTSLVCYFFLPDEADDQPLYHEDAVDDDDDEKPLTL